MKQNGDEVEFVAGGLASKRQGRADFCGETEINQPDFTAIDGGHRRPQFGPTSWRLRVRPGHTTPRPYFRQPVQPVAYLVVEVADASLDYDREEKLPAYGRAGVSEVWIVNLRDHVIEVYREPHFTGYGLKTILRAGDKAIPQAFSDAVVDVGELLSR